MKVAFFGLGNMGLPMARNLAKAGHEVTGYDVVEAARERARAAGLAVADSPAAALEGAEAVITMLPAGPHVREAYLGEDGILAHAPAGALLVDSSTIDVETARLVHREAEARGFVMVDAPVSGGVAGAEAATLTFMVGGSEEAFARAKPLLEAMGRAVIHAGGPGTGQAAKICNNMMLGIQMISVCEAFVLAERLGLEHERLFEIASKSSGQCWSLTSYCPVPGPVPQAPSNRDYRPGFTAAMMLKDLGLAQQTAQQAGSATPLGAMAAQLYRLFVQQGNADIDFSAIIRFIRGERPGG